MPPTITAQRDHANFPARHFPTRHNPTRHYVMFSEILWSTAPKSCMEGTFNIVAAPHEGIFNIAIGQNGFWSEC